MRRRICRGRRGRPSRFISRKIVADAILLAATRRYREIKVSGVTVLFAWAMRLMPGVVNMAIQRLGMEGSADAGRGVRADAGADAVRAVGPGVGGAWDVWGGIPAVQRADVVVATLWVVIA